MSPTAVHAADVLSLGVGLFEADASEVALAPPLAVGVGDALLQALTTSSSAVQATAPARS
jgi:hypothetical protein